MASKLARAMRGRRRQLGTGSTNPDRMVPVEVVVRYVNDLLSAAERPDLRLADVPDTATLQNLMKLVCQALGVGDSGQEGTSPNPQSIPDLPAEAVQPSGWAQFGLVKTSRILSTISPEKRAMIARRVLSQMTNSDRSRRSARQLSKSGMTHKEARQLALRAIGVFPSKDESK
ncbi:hypothetical protein K2Y11_22485 [bacterium]|nr:hypothetical protein [bacterium]